MPEIKRHAIRSWITTIATGDFHYKNILGISGKLSSEDDTKLRKIIYEFCHEKKPVVESIGRRDGWYRPIQNDAHPLEWQHLEERRDSGLILPFDLRKFVFIYPDTTILFAGSKSSGKTGVIYKTVKGAGVGISMSIALNLSLNILIPPSRLVRSTVFTLFIFNATVL